MFNENGDESVSFVSYCYFDFDIVVADKNFFCTDVEAKTHQEDTNVAVSPPIEEVTKSPHCKDEGAMVMVPESPLQAEEVREAVNAEAVREYAYPPSGPSSSSLLLVVIEVSVSLKGLDLRFWLDALRVARLKAREANFERLGIDSSKAFDPVANVIVSESIIFDDIDVGSCMIEALALPRDHHTMLHGKEMTEEYGRKFGHNLVIVSSYFRFLLDKGCSCNCL